MSMVPNLEEYDHILIAFSGGKDSLACLLHVVETLQSRQIYDLVNVELWHHEVDGREGSRLMDWPCTPAYCKAVANAMYLPIYFSWLEGGFEREMLRDDQAKSRTWFETPDGLAFSGGNGKLGTRLKFPQVSADLSVRWCSAYLKIDVFRTAVCNQERFKGCRTLVVSGERAEESPSRAKYKEFESHPISAKSRTVDWWRPVHSWKEEDVWEIIQKYSINPHPAYRLGWGRLSCARCIFADKDQVASAYSIDPGSVEKIAAYENQFGLTINHRKKKGQIEQIPIMEMVHQGTVYPKMKPEDIEAALSLEFDEPIVLNPDDWIMPAGAFKKSGGPT